MPKKIPELREKHAQAEPQDFLTTELGDKLKSFSFGEYLDHKKRAFIRDNLPKLFCGLGSERSALNAIAKLRTQKARVMLARSIDAWHHRQEQIAHQAQYVAEGQLRTTQVDLDIKMLEVKQQLEEIQATKTAMANSLSLDDLAQQFKTHLEIAELSYEEEMYGPPMHPIYGPMGMAMPWRRSSTGTPREQSDVRRAAERMIRHFGRLYVEKVKATLAQTGPTKEAQDVDTVSAAESK